MRVLVTGGTGVIGAGVLPSLIGAGHKIRLLTRNADKAAREWPESVEPFVGDVTQLDQLEGAADDCDAIVHISGIVTEAPPDLTRRSKRGPRSPPRFRSAATSRCAWRT